MGNLKVTRIKLDIEQNPHYILLGLVSPEPDYKLSLAINRKFRISLRHISPIDVPHPDGSPIQFSRFSNHDHSDNDSLTLISNRSGKSFLLGKLKNIDYLLQISASEEDADIDSITALLRETGAVSAVFNIDTGKLRDKNLYLLNQ